MQRFAAAGLMNLARRLDPETAHNLSLRALRLGLSGRDVTPDDPCLQVSAFGRVLRNPIGLAAGFDKNAAAVTALGRLGFGFVEAGTVTPRPQTGNPKPRLFRLAEDGAVINRMGFNNAGIDVFAKNFARANRSVVPVGANIGINKEGAKPAVDYPALARIVSPLADYITVNVSSPNTPGLRDLQGEVVLAGILGAIETKLPVFVKIAPDLSDDGLAAVVGVCAAAKVAGLIISNTTLARPAGLRGPHISQAGGLSGRPLLAPSTAMLAKAYHLAAGRLMLIGVGGIFSAEDAFAKILAGASLVQVYTGFAYQGPAMIPALKTGLARLVHAHGFKTISDAVGATS
jgi:dihydroorotate dehydrogenase